MPYTENLGGHKLNVNGKIITIEYIPAATSNWTQTYHDKYHYISHQIVGSLQSAINIFSRTGGGASATFSLNENRIIQHVPLSAYAWANGNYGYNQSGISVEHEAAWLLPNGERAWATNGTLETSAHLHAYLENVIYETSDLLVRGQNHFKHNEVSDSYTECCNWVDIDYITRRTNELITAGYNGSAIQTTQTVTTPTVDWKNNLVEVNEKRTLERTSQIYDIDSKVGSGSWSAGHEVDVKYTLTQDGVKYYLAGYSVDTLNLKRGFRAKDFVPKVDPTSWLDRVVPNPNKELQFVLAGGLIEIATGNAVTKDGEPIVYPQGTVVTMGWIYTHTDGKQYYMSTFSKDAKKMNGIPAVQVDPVDQSADQIASLEAQIAALQATNAASLNQISQLESAGVSSSNTINTLQSAANESQAAIEELQQELAQAKAENASLQQTNNQQSINISELEEQLANVENADLTPEVDSHFWDHVKTMGAGEIAAAAQEKLIDFKQDAEADVAAEVQAGADPAKWSWARIRLGIAQMNIYNAIIAFLGMVSSGEAVEAIANIPQGGEMGATAGMIMSVVLVIGQQLKRIFKND